MRIGRGKGAMGMYLVEAYHARLRDSELAQRTRLLQAAANELSREGHQVRYLRTVYLPEDETCFHVYEAASAGAVREACRRAGIAYDRVLDAVEIAHEDAGKRPAPPLGLSATESTLQEM